MALLGNHGVLQQLAMSPTLLTLLFVTIVGFALTPFERLLDTTFATDGINISATLSLRCMRFVRDHTVSQELTLPPTFLLALLFVTVIGFVSTPFETLLDAIFADNDI